MQQLTGHISALTTLYTCSEVADLTIQVLSLHASIVFCSMLLLAICLETIDDMQCVALPLCNLISLSKALSHAYSRSVCIHLSILLFTFPFK